MTPAKALRTPSYILSVRSLEKSSLIKIFKVFCLRRICNYFSSSFDYDENFLIDPNQTTNELKYMIFSTLT